MDPTQVMHRASPKAYTTPARVGSIHLIDARSRRTRDALCITAVKSRSGQLIACLTDARGFVVDALGDARCITEE